MRHGQSHCERSRCIYHCPHLQGTQWSQSSGHHVALSSHSHWQQAHRHPPIRDKDRTLNRNSYDCSVQIHSTVCHLFKDFEINKNILHHIRSPCLYLVPLNLRRRSSCDDGCKCSCLARLYTQVFSGYLDGWRT